MVKSAQLAGYFFFDSVSASFLGSSSRSRRMKVRQWNL